MTDVEQQLARWAPVAEQIASARRRAWPPLSKRAAARLARISEAHWRHIEAGKRNVGGVDIPPAVSASALESAATAMRLDPRPLFELLGWDYQPSEPRVYLDTNMDSRLTRLEETVEAMKEDVGGLQAEVRQLLRRLGPEATGAS